MSIILKVIKVGLIYDIASVELIDVNNHQSDHSRSTMLVGCDPLYAGASEAEIMDDKKEKERKEKVVRQAAFPVAA